jgi:3-(3-hydroxy-phenyl)propionate hydroxylase
MEERRADYDVLVCGLGPVGQLLSLLLARAGVSVLAVDAASGPFDLPRAAVVDDEVLRVFQSAGVVEQVIAECQVQEAVSFVPERGGRLPILEPVDGTQGHPPLISIHQPTMEQSLLDALGGQPLVTERWSTRLDRFEQRVDGPEPHVEALLCQDDGSAESVTARYLVGCDGAASRVRQLLGIEFGGFTFKQRWLVVDVAVDRPIAKVPHPHFFGDWRRPIVSLPMSPGRHRWEWMLHPGEDPEPFLDPEAVRARIEPWLDGEQAEVERAVIYTFHARTASRWRDGRVFLAGDAAHVMPPFAGQGFSSGARDAGNLAWKLEAVLNGAPESLLDTYEAERRPHVKAMTRLALGLGKFVQTRHRPVAAVRDAYLSAMEASGLSGWLRERIKPVPAYGEGAFAAKPHAVAPLRGVGSQFPQPVVLAGGEEVLLDEAAGPGWCAIAVDPADAAALARDGLRVLLLGLDLEDPSGEVGAWLERFGAQWVVLRPDRFVFAAGAGAEDVRDALDAIHRHAGRLARPAEDRAAVPA